MSDKLKRALTVADVENYRPKTLPFYGKWYKSFGTPEHRGSILLYGMPKNGKTDLAMQMAVYLTKFGRVVYNSVEEGLSASMQDAVRRNRLCEVSKRFHLLDRETVAQLTARLKRRQSADFVFIDSVQRIGMTTREYETLKSTFPNKLFILISHVDDAGRPDGKAARNIKRYSDAFAFVQGFVAYPTCRIEGGEPFVIWPEKAAKVGQI